MANIGYRTFNGTSDVADLNIGNIASGSSLDCWIWAGRMLSDAIGGEIISCPGYDPLDLYAVNDGGHNTVRMYDGAVDSSADSPSGPAWFAGDGFVIMAARRVSSTVIRWSKAVYSGGAWGTFTHTNGQTVFGNRTYPSSGVLTVGNAAPINIDLALIARTTSSSDADIATLTTDLTKWTGLPNVTNVWRFDGGSIVDLKGTASQSSLTGTAVTANGFPLDAGSSAVTGTSARTLGSFVSAGTGSTVVGSSARTLGSFVSAGAGTVGSSTVTGTSARTLGSFVSAGTGSTVVGSSARTLGSFVSAGAGTASPGFYILKDDFNGSSIDTSIWTVYERLGDQVNSEVDGLLAANVTESSGTLKIDQKYVPAGFSSTDTTTAGAPLTVNYSSGQIAQASAPFQYGRVEVRAKIPGGTGNWPCIWMLGNLWQASQPSTANVAGSNWPVGGWCEIDIAEFWQGHRTTVNTSLHWNTPGSLDERALPFDATTRFMVYRFDWTPTSMTWMVDAEDGVGPRVLRTVTGTAGVEIVNVPCYLVIHCAIGGSGGTTPNPATYPTTMEVDWARITPANSAIGVAANNIGSFASAGTGTAAAPTVTGTSARTLGSFTSAGVGAHGVAGSSARTLAPFASAGTGTATPPTVTGSSSTTLGSFTSAGAGTVSPPGVSGSSATTLAPFVSAGSGAHGVAGTATGTLAPFVSAGSGAVTPATITGSSSTTLGSFVSAGSGTATPPTITGSSNTTLGSFVSAGSGTATPPTITGSSTTTLGSFTSAGSGSVNLPGAVAGSGATTLGPFVSVGAGTVTPPNVTGSSTTTLAPFVSAGAGAVGVRGSASSTLSAFTSAGVGVAYTPIVGASATTLAPFVSHGGGAVGAQNVPVVLEVEWRQPVAVFEWRNTR